VRETAAVLVSEPTFEADLQSEQYAYRQDRSALDAVSGKRAKPAYAAASPPSASPRIEGRRTVRAVPLGRGDGLWVMAALPN
jgi:hypothetical protein